MAVTSWKTPGTVSNVPNSSSTADWASTGNVAASDNSYATVGPLGTAQANVFSNFLRCRNFGFTTSDIPSGATINGIEIEVERKSSSPSRGTDRNAFLSVHSAGTAADQVGSDQETTDALIGSSDATRTYGGASSLWGTSVADSTARSSTFGFDYAVENNANGTPTMSVDLVRMRVYYTPANTQYNQSCLANTTPAKSDVHSMTKPALAATTPTKRDVHAIGKLALGTTTPTKRDVHAIAKSLLSSTTPTKRDVHAVSRILRASSTLAASIASTIQRVLSALASSTPAGTLTRQIGKPALAATIPVGGRQEAVAVIRRATTTPAAARQIALANFQFGASQPIASLVRQSTRLARSTSDAIASAVKATSRVFGSTTQPAGSFASSPTFPKSLLIASTPVASGVASRATNVDALRSITVTVSAAHTAGKSLGVAVDLAASLRRATARVFTVSATSTPSLLRSLLRSALRATEPVASRSASIALTRRQNAASVTNLIKSTTKTGQLAVEVTAAFFRGALREAMATAEVATSRLLSILLVRRASSNVTLATTHGVSKSLLSAPAAVPTAIKSTTKTGRISVEVVPSGVHLPVRLALAVSNVIARGDRAYGLLRHIVAISETSLRREVDKLINRSAAPAASLNRGLSRSISLSISVTASLRRQLARLLSAEVTPSAAVARILGLPRRISANLIASASRSAAKLARSNVTVTASRRLGTNKSALASVGVITSLLRAQTRAYRIAVSVVSYLNPAKPRYVGAMTAAQRYVGAMPVDVLYLGPNVLFPL